MTKEGNAPTNKSLIPVPGSLVSPLALHACAYIYIVWNVYDCSKSHVKKMSKQDFSLNESARQPDPEASLDIDRDDVLVKGIFSALDAFNDLYKKSNEQKQRIDSELVALSQEVDESIKEIASLKQKADEVDARIKDTKERREKSMDNLQKQVSDLDTQWKNLAENLNALAGAS